VRAPGLELFDAFLNVLGPPYFDVSGHIHLEYVEIATVHGVLR
jgi:hypothetical protein